MATQTASTMTDKHFRDWENHVFGYGYGDGERHILPALKAVIEPLEGSYDFRNLQTEFDGLATWLLINVLCKAGIIEYGTSPRFGWLSPRGKILQQYLATKSADELVEMIVEWDDNDPRCWPNVCQCDVPCENPLF